jgi:hypothetical protein
LGHGLSGKKILAIALRSTAETAGGVSLPGEINSPPGPINLILAFYLEYNKKLGIWISNGAAGWKFGRRGLSRSGFCAAGAAAVSTKSRGTIYQRESADQV